MKVKDWLKKDPPLDERLKVIGSLCNALADSHRRSVVHGGLAPTTISVVNDGGVRLEPPAAGAGTPYAAPELARGGPPTAKADIYSAAAVIYEVLSGKPPFESDPPRPLQEARPDLSQDLTDAVSACMEQDPEWRPADLAYLVAVVQQLQKDTPARSSAPTPRASAQRASGPAPTFLNTAPGKRHDDRSAITRALPLILVIVAIAGTGAAWLWYNVLRPAKPGSSAMQAGRRPPTAPPSAQAEPPAAALAPAGEPTSAPSAALPGPLPTARPSQATAPTARPASPGPAPSSRPSPPPAQAAVATAPPSTMAAAVPDAGTTQPAPPPPPEPEPTAAATDAPSAGEASGPAAIRAVAPFRLRAGALQVLDVHGAGLRADHRVKIVSLRKRAPATGFVVTRYQLRNPSLLLVFVQLDASMPPGKYALSLVDAGGAETNPFTIEVGGK